MANQRRSCLCRQRMKGRSFRFLLQAELLERAGHSQVVARRSKKRSGNSGGVHCSLAASLACVRIIVHTTGLQDVVWPYALILVV